MNFNNESINDMNQLQKDIEQLQKEYMAKKASGDLDGDSSDDEEVGGRLMEQLELLMVKEKIDVLNQKIAAIMA